MSDTIRPFFHSLLKVHMKREVDCNLLSHISMFPVKTVRQGGAHSVSAEYAL